MLIRCDATFTQRACDQMPQLQRQWVQQNVLALCGSCRRFKSTAIFRERFTFPIVRVHVFFRVGKYKTAHDWVFWVCSQVTYQHTVLAIALQPRGGRRSRKWATSYICKQGFYSRRSSVRRENRERRRRRRVGLLGEKNKGQSVVMTMVWLCIIYTGTVCVTVNFSLSCLRILLTICVPGYIQLEEDEICLPACLWFTYVENPPSNLQMFCGGEVQCLIWSNDDKCQY